MERHVIFGANWLLIRSWLWSCECWMLGLRGVLRHSTPRWLSVKKLMMSSDASGYTVTLTSILTPSWIAFWERKKEKKAKPNSCPVVPHSSLMCSIPRSIPWVKVSEMTFLQVINSFTATPLARAAVAWEALLKNHVHSDVCSPIIHLTCSKLMFFPCACHWKNHRNVMRYDSLMAPWSQKSFSV